jgi:hypothetical protein
MLSNIVIQIADRHNVKTNQTMSTLFDPSIGLVPTGTASVMSTYKCIDVGN